MNAEFLEVVADVGEQLGERNVEHLRVRVGADELADAFDDRVHIDFFVAAFGFIRRQAFVDVGSRPAQRVADDFAQFRGDGLQVFRWIAVLRDDHRLAEGLQVTQPEARRENVHLPAGIVDVVLAMYGIAGGREHVRQRSAVSSVTTVSHVQRAGRVR